MEDKTLSPGAISVVWYCLETVAFNARLEGKFLGPLLSPNTDKYEDWLYQYNENLLATYFSICLLAPNRETLEFYCEQAGLHLE